MKDAFLNPLVQALLCLAAAAGLLVLSAKFPGAENDDIRNGLKMLSGSAATLWINLPRKSSKSDSSPASGAIALLCVLGLAGQACSSVTKQAQMNAVEVATQAANEVGQGVLSLYHYQLGSCVEQASTEMDYTICKMAVDQVWGPVRVKYASLRRVQNEYATALERGDMGTADYFQWFRVAYCELMAVAPPELVLPPVPGLECADGGAQ